MVIFFQKAIKFVVLPLFLAFVAFLGEVRAKPPDVVVVDKDTDKPYPFDILKANTWQPVEKGLQFLRMSETVMRDRGEGENQKLPVTVDFDILKFDPAYFDFSVYGAVTDKTESKALLAWLQQYDLTAVINSSMYLTDGKTSIGYLRKNDVYNNNHIGKSLGAFFVSCPYEKYQGKIPSCSIIYDNDPDLDTYFSQTEKERTLENALKKYSVVVQNFKLVDLPDNQSEWKAQRRHYIAAVAQDEDNEILLMYASKPLTVQEFRTVLHKNGPLRIKRAMYAEGGAEASMAYRKKTVFLWQHEENIMLFLKGTVKLPNIIGIKRKQ